MFFDKFISLILNPKQSKTLTRLQTFWSKPSRRCTSASLVCPAGKVLIVGIEPGEVFGEVQRGDHLEKKRKKIALMALFPWNPILIEECSECGDSGFRDPWPLQVRFARRCAISSLLLAGARRKTLNMSCNRFRCSDLAWGRWKSCSRCCGDHAGGDDVSWQLRSLGL